MSLNTLSNLCRSDLPVDGMFTREIEPTYSILFNKNVWEQLVSQHLNANRSGFKHRTWQSPFIAILKKINPYCSVMFKRHRVMLPEFRKSRTSIIFRAEGYCKHSTFTLKKIRVKLTEDLTVSLEFEGTTIQHKIGETQARPIQGIERQKFKVSGLNPPLKEYCQRINYIPGEIFAAGKRGNAGTSRDVWKQIRYEKKIQHRLDTIELDSLLKLKKKISIDDNKQTEKVKGFIQHISVEPDMLFLWTRASVKIFHDMSVQDTIFWHVTGHVFKSKLTSKKLFYYEITVRNPKTNSISLPLASMVSSAHTHTVILFLTLFRNHEKQIYGIDKLSQPLQINSDRAMTFVLSALIVFNSENLLQFLERVWRIDKGNAKDNVLTLTKVHNCSFHLMRNARDIVKSSYTSQGPRSDALWMISLLMNATTLQEMNTVFAIIVNITCSKQVTQNVLQNVGIMNKKIGNFRVTLNQKEIAIVYGSVSLSEVDEALTREELRRKRLCNCRQNRHLRNTMMTCM